MPQKIDHARKPVPHTAPLLAYIQMVAGSSTGPGPTCATASMNTSAVRIVANGTPAIARPIAAKTV